VEGEAVNGDGSAGDPFAQIDPTAVSIVVDRNIERPLGTGFYFLRPSYFVTAKHVVVDSKTGAARDNLVLMQRGPDYPRVSIAYLHPSIDLAVLHVDRPVCSIPLYPSHERLTGHRGLRYWGYAPSKKDPSTNIFPVLVVDLPAYTLEEPRERDDGLEYLLRFDSPVSEPGHSGGPVLGLGGGVVAVITEGNEGWVRATGIETLMALVEMRF
jgi:Trypsin-like peptidase domain